MAWAPLWERQVAGPATHAFVIGVSDYPAAKPRTGYEAKLRGVLDIPSADASAMLVADWLFRSKDSLVAPLASLEVLLGSAAVPSGRNQYRWRDFAPARAPAEPTMKNVTDAGKSWLARLQAGQQNVAFFFICGHGAVKDTQHVVFLKDLNGDDDDPWGSYINLFQLAHMLKQEPSLASALLYADACQEFIPAFELEDTRGGVRFKRLPKKYVAGKEKVMLLSASSPVLKAYEGEWKEDRAVRIGRFTETLVEALCTSVRNDGLGGWQVNSHSVQQDLKGLHRVRRPDWQSIEFEPSVAFWPNELLPIANVANPVVPIVIQTIPPDKISSCAFNIYLDPQRQPPPFASRQPGDASEWVSDLHASMAPHLLEASIGGTIFNTTFYPQYPLFSQRIRVTPA